MSLTATITRKGTFDYAHRVVHQTSACRFIHGHLGQYELSFDYKDQEDIGYAIDFKEIKRIACQFIDDYFDHGFIGNPHDTSVIDLCQSENSKIWIMSLNGDNFCNPTAENISKEIFLSVNALMKNFSPNLILSNVRLYETPNCFVDCTPGSISTSEYVNFHKTREELLNTYREQKGVVEYDSRKIKI